MSEQNVRVAILDDYNHASLKMADWSAVQQRCIVDVHDKPYATIDEAVTALASYDILCHLRERQPMPRELIERLPNLKMMTVTGATHRTMDMQAAGERGIVVSHSVDRPGGSQGTPELTFGLMIAAVRKIALEDRRIRTGLWQSTIGFSLTGKTLGIIGLGKIGKRIATIGKAFGMNIIAWSPNLTEERAREANVTRVEKDDLFRQADVVTLHIVLGEKTRGIVGAREFALMKPTAYIVNTSRGPLIDEAALIDTLQNGRIAGAGLDVYHREPLGPDYPLYKLDNVVLTPHLGYVVEESFRAFYGDTVENILAWLDGNPIRVVNAQFLKGAA
jgi:phosphoglycerate dehydrogenase-like enzyme